MNKWSQYFKEREGYDCFESEAGIASYKVINQDCYLRDIYILPQFRRGHEGTHIANEIAKIAREKGCKFLTGSVVPSLNGSTASISALLAYGFKIRSSHEDFIMFEKEI